MLGSSYIKLPHAIIKKKACINVKNYDNACFAWAIVSALCPVNENSDRITQYPHYDFDVHPTYLTKSKKNQHVNLLLIQNIYYNDDNFQNDVEHSSVGVQYHFVWIKDLSRLLSSQLSKHNGKKHFCDRCLHYFNSEANLMAHLKDCTSLNNLSDNSKKYQEHVPCSIGYYVKCEYDPTLSFYKSVRGPNCITWFVKELEKFAEDVETVFLCPLPMDKLTEEQNKDFESAKLCHICEGKFDHSDQKVRDHCHLTGKFRGPAHEGCNLNFQDSHTIPIVFHNLSGYDSHFIIKNLATDLQGRVDLLPINKERYISFTKQIEDFAIKFRFIDSFRFMSCSLDTLASYLNSYPILESEFKDMNIEQINLLKRKGVYPYDYFENFDIFLENRLPSIDKFYNKLNNSAISEKDYIHAQKVWQTLKIKNLGEYSDLYLKTDVLLLADTFEQFRLSCHQTYSLDPAHYYTLPGYTWDCMLKYSDITLELLTDIDMLMFVERGIRGGLSQCTKRYSKANNKYMSDYNPSIPSKYLMYNDINNQYGWAMSQPLPEGEFKWCDTVANFKVESIIDSSQIGYFFEVDLEYPQEIHNLHKDLPFCPEHISAPHSKQKKLLATLNNKSRYIIHYRNLKQAIKNGLKVLKIHRILQFKQSPWLKSYIDLNTKLRTQARNDFEKNLFKLMNNAVFGMSILDLAKTTIYDFHYDYMLPQFNKNCTICYTDTDSLIYEINCPDLYEIIRRDCHLYFDTSDYSIDNKWGIPLVNKKVLGLMKDENNGKIMTEFVGLRSKMYAIRVEGNENLKKIT
ncbi:uncharacterized protein LOC129616887 [Condylostylus longicornis]|uniref:uncharacterized protein LOC129616887 n=1 Tax=Condylostylus longicornis TaxID=2530218 RepID=UPI00244DAE55|nr:uncharacterized protein LOC129616887 [Condylostylus longicornis]